MKGLNYHQENDLPFSSAEGSVALFGGHEDDFNDYLDDCTFCAGYKWYQVGCHLEAIADWIEEHPETVGVIIAVFTAIAG